MEKLVILDDNQNRTDWLHLIQEVVILDYKENNVEIHA